MAGLRIKRTGFVPLNFQGANRKAGFYDCIMKHHRITSRSANRWLTTCLGVLLAGILAGCSAISGTPEFKDVEKVEFDGWTTDFEKALNTAREEDRKILALFTGSDWCPPCMAMNDGLFNTRPFADFAEENLVTVMFDFPRRKQLPPELAEQNHLFAQMMRVGPFPTVIVLDSSGRELRRIGGYMRVHPNVYLEWIATGNLPPEMEKAFAGTFDPI